jgi:hypothetical protein
MSTPHQSYIKPAADPTKTVHSPPHASPSRYQQRGPPAVRVPPRGGYQRRTTAGTRPTGCQSATTRHRRPRSPTARHMPVCQHRKTRRPSESRSGSLGAHAMRQPSEGPLRGPIGRLLDRLVDRLFADEDAHATARGWEVRRLPGGGRAYRDPRWNSISRCDSCGGTGRDAASAACLPCDGTGVLRATPPVPVPRPQPQDAPDDAEVTP